MEGRGHLEHVRDAVQAQHRAARQVRQHLVRLRARDIDLACAIGEHADVLRRKLNGAAWASVADLALWARVTDSAVLIGPDYLLTTLERPPGAEEPSPFVRDWRARASDHRDLRIAGQTARGNAVHDDFDWGYQLTMEDAAAILLDGYSSPSAIRRVMRAWVIDEKDIFGIADRTEPAERIEPPAQVHEEILREAWDELSREELAQIRDLLPAAYGLDLDDPSICDFAALEMSCQEYECEPSDETEAIIEICSRHIPINVPHVVRPFALALRAPGIPLDERWQWYTVLRRRIGYAEAVWKAAVGGDIV